MRRFDKKLNIQNANQLAEQRYLTIKGIINESFGESSLYEDSSSSLDLSNSGNLDAFKSVLHRTIFENLDYFNFSKVGNKAIANDNMVILTTKILPGFFKSPQVPLNYRSSSNEIWTNNPDFMKEYLSMIGEDPSKYTFWDSNDNQVG
jgi:hypothetical protein